jgi:hypothetical protein
MATLTVARPDWSYRLLPSRKIPLTLILAAYLALGVMAFWPAILHITTTPFGVESDYILAVWFMGWVPHALAHGLNPFFSHAILVPQGVNLGQNTASPLLDLLAAPLAFLSPLVRTNLLMIVAMPVSAAAGLAALRKWNVSLGPAAIGGLIYGFSPYMVGRQLGHLELMFVPIPPFIALVVASILRRQGSPTKLGIQLGLLITAQYLISPEVLAAVAVVTGVAVVFVAIGNRSQILDVARFVRRPIVLALGIAAVILAYPIWMLLAGPGHASGTPWPIENPYHNDLFSFGVPSPLQRVPLGLRSVGNRISGPAGATEAGGYIGIPLLLVSGLLAWRGRRGPRMQLAAGLFIVCAILSLGPHLDVNGRATGFPLPFLLLDHIPLLNDILPTRMNLLMFACLGALIAFGLDDLRNTASIRTSAPAVVGMLALVSVTLLPLWPQPAPYTPVPRSTLPAAIRRSIPHSTILTYPYASLYGMDPMLWQAQDGYRFDLLGGYAYHSNPGGSALYPNTMSPGLLQQFLASQGGFPVYGPAVAVNSALASSAKVTLTQADIHGVLVNRAFPGSAPVMKLFLKVLGPPTVSSGTFSLWTKLP